MKAHKRNRFFVFSGYRAVLFVGLCGVLIFLWIVGPSLWRFYFGSENTFYYKKNALAVHYIDVGQGDCSVVQFPDGRVAVIDGGTDYYYSRIKTYLTTRVLRGSERIDFVIATHSHNDHVGSLVRLVSEFDIGVVYRPHNKSNSPVDGEGGIAEGEALAPLASTIIYADFITAAYAWADRVEFIEAGEEISAGGANGYSMFFHTPTASQIGGLADGFTDFNDISPIITLLYGDNLFMFTGDAGFATELAFEVSSTAIEMKNEGLFEDCTVWLKVGHHGSRNSTSARFLNFIYADVAIISLSANNTYGFPHAELISRLSATGAEILQTSLCGNIAVQIGSDGEHIYYAFDNAIDMVPIVVVGFIFIFVVCFVDFGVFKVQPQRKNNVNKKRHKS